MHRLLTCPLIHKSSQQVDGNEVNGALHYLFWCQCSLLGQMHPLLLRWSDLDFMIGPPVNCESIIMPFDQHVGVKLRHNALGIDYLVFTTQYQQSYHSQILSLKRDSPRPYRQSDKTQETLAWAYRRTGRDTPTHFHRLPHAHRHTKPGCKRCHHASSYTAFRQ